MANQYTSKHDLKTLPQWAQSIIYEQTSIICGLDDKLETIQNINAVMCEPKREWFTLPFSHDDGKPVHLWLLDKDQPISVCSLSKGDLLFVGRAKKDVV